MPEANERFDRARDDEAPFHRLSDRFWEIKESVAIVKTQLEGLVGKVDGLGTRVESLASNYATKADLSDRDKRIDGLADNQRWIVRIIVSAVVIAVLGVIFKYGVHT